ncbi:MAG TPA: hypothetical protein VF703_02570 [Pyrinomonadaceae bacterium]
MKRGGGQVCCGAPAAPTRRASSHASGEGTAKKNSRARSFIKSAPASVVG